MNKCEYCNTREAKYQLMNGRWCCERKVQKCPGTKEKARKKQALNYQWSTKPLMEKLASTGLVQCRYCDRPGTHYKGFYLGEHRFQCEEICYDCPGYHDYLSNVHKKSFEENPDLKIKLSKTMKKVQNRPDVKSKKSNTMIQLHRGDCEPCVEFQKNYMKAQKKRRGENYEYFKKYNKNSVYPDDIDIIADVETDE